MARGARLRRLRREHRHRRPGDDPLGGQEPRLRRRLHRRRRTWPRCSAALKAGGATAGRCAGAWPPAPTPAPPPTTRRSPPGSRGQVGEAWPARKSIAGAAEADHALWREPAPGGGALRLPDTRARASPPRASCRARSSATTTSTTPTRPWSWSPSSTRPPAAAVAIIKHANPCGVALGADLKSAYERALQCDPVSAFGGIVAVNRRLDAAAARGDRQDLHRGGDRAGGRRGRHRASSPRRKNLRLLLTGALPDPPRHGRDLQVGGRRLPGAGARRRRGSPPPT